MRTPRSATTALLAAALLALAACASLPPPDVVRAALAPSGRLRVAVYPGSPTSLVRDAATGETKGVALDLGRRLAERLGVPFEPVELPNNAAVQEAVKRGEADIAFTNATPARAKDMDFTPPVLAVDQGYLAAPGSSIASQEDVDRAGTKVGVSRGSTSQAVLSQSLRNATVVPVPDLATGSRMLKAGELQAYATNKAILAEMAARVPGARPVPGRWGVENFAVGVPKGREAGHAWLREAVAQARDDGTIATAVERAGLRGIAGPARP